MDLNINTINITSCTITNLSSSNINFPNYLTGLTNLTIGNLQVTNFITPTDITTATINISGASTLQGLTATTLTATGITSVSSLHVAGATRFVGLTTTNFSATGDTVTASTTVNSLAVTANVVGAIITVSSLAATAPIYHTSTSNSQVITGTATNGTPSTILYAANASSNGITFDTGTGIATIGTAGWYYISAFIRYPDVVGYKMLYIEKNSTTSLSTYRFGNYLVGATLNAYVNLAASDTIRVRTVIATTATLEVDSNIAILRIC